MEASPIVKAHDHAQKAAVATRQSSDTTVAINEHTQAAGEFANAASVTTSVEALRTLKLLEEHHRRLAELLTIPPEQHIPTPGNADFEDGGAAEKEVSNEKGRAVTRGTVRGKAAQLPGLTQSRRMTSREMSSSIASNLASARGIRSKYRGQPLSPSISNDQAPGNLDSRPRRDESKRKMQGLADLQPGKPTWVPPNAATAVHREPSVTSQTIPTSPNPASVDDAGYTRFYNTFGSLLNKISAPLAFAGLPLIQEESDTSQKTTSSSQDLSPTASSSARTHAESRRPPTSASADPDLSQIYSKATMRALAREGHGASDSFYVVPTSGHTMSYANILNYAEKEKRRLETSTHASVGESVEDEDDDFVDARETAYNLSPGTRRRTGKTRTDRDLHNTIEELSTENKSLKDMLDKLTKRLHAFEASAQNRAMALAESYRFMRPDSPVSTKASGKAALTEDEEESSRKKQQELEEQLSSTMSHVEKLERDNRKMQKTLDKYREKWEVLKAGAKARREAQGPNETVEDAEPS